MSFITERLHICPQGPK